MRLHTVMWKVSFRYSEQLVIGRCVDVLVPHVEFRLTALFKIVVTPHFGYMGGHAKYKSGVHSYLVKLELWNSYPPCLARQPTDQHPHLPYPS